MALAAGNIFSTSIVGIGVLCIVILAVRNIWKKRKEGGCSGCGCSAVTLSAYILKQLEVENWKKVLFMPTGALLSKTSFNEGMSVPGIAHAIVLESVG